MESISSTRRKERRMSGDVRAAMILAEITGRSKRVETSLVLARRDAAGMSACATSDTDRRTRATQAAATIQYPTCELVCVNENVAAIEDSSVTSIASTVSQYSASERSLARPKQR